jgi:uncharacterized protein DUF6950
MALKRFPDWQRRLAAQMEKARAAKFAWGTFDCALAVCDAIAAITGVDPAAPYRGKYATEAEATALIGDDLGAFAAGIFSNLGAKEVRPTFARRGDVVLVNNTPPSSPSGIVSTALGFVDLSGAFAPCASGDKGVVRVRMGRWLRAWQIG